MEEIKAIKDREKPALMFDLGGVIMDIRRENCVKALGELGMENAGDFLGDYGQKGLFLALERGDITPEEFRDRLRPMLRPGVTDAEIDGAFNKFLIGIPVERLRRLRQLREKYPVYMLSNTNAIMWNGKIAEEFRKDGHDRDYYFDGCVASFDVNAYKPDAEIFGIAREKFGLDPAETIFFDDSKENCAAAERCGFRSVWADPSKDFLEIVSEY